MGPPLPLKIRYILQRYKEAGLTAKQLLECLNKYHPEIQPSIQTIHNIFKLINETGDVEINLQGNVGRKPKLNEEQKEQITEMFHKEPTLSLRNAQQSQQITNQLISHQTVANIKGDFIH